MNFSVVMIALPKKFKPSEKDLKRAVAAAKKRGNCDELFDDEEPFDEKDLWEQYGNLKESGRYCFNDQGGDIGSPEPLLELLKDHVVTSSALEGGDDCEDHVDCVQLMSKREISSAKKALRRAKD